MPGYATTLKKNAVNPFKNKSILRIGLKLEIQCTKDIWPHSEPKGIQTPYTDRRKNNPMTCLRYQNMLVVKVIPIENDLHNITISPPTKTS